VLVDIDRNAEQTVARDLVDPLASRGQLVAGPTERIPERFDPAKTLPLRFDEADELVSGTNPGDAATSSASMPWG
jgi:hypothetical protein